MPRRLIERSKVRFATITLTEEVFHPGHYRVALAPDPAQLPADPKVTAGSTPCGTAEIQNPPPQLSLQLSEPTGTSVLTLDEAVQTSLDNNPSIKAARERIGAQQAVL